MAHLLYLYPELSIDFYFLGGYKVSLGGHTKAVTALSVDPAGGRVATGGVDYKVCQLSILNV